MSKLELEKEEEPEIKLPTSIGLQKKQKNSGKTSACASLSTLKPLILWITTNCGKFFKKWEYQTILPACLLCYLYIGQEATAKTRHGTMDWFKIGKGVCQCCLLSLCLFNLKAEYIMQTAGLDEAQAGIKIAWRNINKLRYADGTSLMTESRGTEEPFDESERGE